MGHGTTKTTDYAIEQKINWVDSYKHWYKSKKYKLL